MEVLEPQRFKMIVRTGVGPIKGTFAFDVRFEELREPEHAVVRAHGQMPGSVVDMVSVMDLSPADEGHTAMRWSSDVTVSGTIASVGARLMQGVADKTVQQVFACLKEKLEAPAATPAE
jgi:carbon monoxide dehydrogenase subunit G